MNDVSKISPFASFALPCGMYYVCVYVVTSACGAHTHSTIPCAFYVTIECVNASRNSIVHTYTYTIRFYVCTSLVGETFQTNHTIVQIYYIYDADADVCLSVCLRFFPSVCVVVLFASISDVFLSSPPIHISKAADSVVLQTTIYMPCTYLLHGCVCLCACVKD